MSVLSTLTFAQGRTTTQPLRAVAIALYASVFVIDSIVRAMGWCGEAAGAPFYFGLILLLGVFVSLEWAEQRYFVAGPPLLAAIGVIGLRIVLVELIGFMECLGFSSFFALIPVLLAYLYIGPRAAYFTAIINILIYCFWIFPIILSGDEPLAEIHISTIIDFFAFLTGTLFVIVMGRVLVFEERNRQEAEALVRQLERSQLQVAELAAVEERNRIARDIHDSVGHHLTAINVQLEKAIAFRPIDAAEADMAVHDAKRSAQSALADVRESVSTLRDPQQAFVLAAALRQLVGRFAHIPITLRIVGDEALYAKSTLIALYRVAQEGLTNIEKHAHAKSAELHVTLRADTATLRLQDDGVGVDEKRLAARAAAHDDHFGLLGLRERLELLGGTLTITQQTPRGTLLCVDVPARGLG